ncbi:exodeoxyribonuclease VII small subunit [Corynebacterium sp. H128]|uniref:exodeoxyribonuclease VII small subunit n=1 Tax=unclassified Corynebacterium TaxID=2624378 RepID=UPI0030B1772E
MNTDVIGSGTAGENAFPAVETLSYEAAREELVETVKILELGQMGLEESLKYWERGEALAKRCEEHLAGAAQRVEAVINRKDD